MYIVGTSGHIDHGKTALIKALTGIDCDRLPEEKKREMTIDLGFAQIDYPKFGTVSIIDVPGHERFIRNMVAGAWGVDLALLVIAVDDSWMPQTEDHFRVIELLGIERIIVVLTKIDLADDEMIEIVEEEVKERLQDTRFEDAQIIKVSAKENKGLDELKTLIKKNLEKLSKVVNADKPYLYIDRVFASKGYGTVITGTLKNGKFHDDDTVNLLPGNKEVRIKRIESHNKELTEGAPSQRTALNLSGISLEDLKRGHIIIKDNFFLESSDIFAVIQLLDEKKRIKNNLEIEILIGTSSRKGKLIYIQNDKNSILGLTVRIKLSKPWFFYPGEPFIITYPGGYRIIGGGKVVFPEYAGIKDRKFLLQNLHILQDTSLETILEFNIKISSFIRKEILISSLPNNIKNIEKILHSIAGKGIIKELDGFMIDSEFFEISKGQIAEAITNNVGLNLKEISDQTNIDIDVIKIIIAKVMEDSAITEKDGRYFAGDSITIETLSEDKKKTLSTVLSKGTEGLELDKNKNDTLKKDVKELIKLGFLISLDGNIIYHIEIYEDLKARIMKLFETSDKITIPDAKDATSLSRKYIIPLLNRIESDGLMKRIGDFRIKA